MKQIKEACKSVVISVPENSEIQNNHGFTENSIKEDQEGIIEENPEGIAPAGTERKFCSECGGKLEAGAKFCNRCGKKI